MQLLRISFAVAALLAAAALSSQAQVYSPQADDHPHPHPAPLRGPEPANQPAQPVLATVSHTLYSTKSELYAEFKPLVAGQATRFTAHLTRLGPAFRPYTDGQVTLTLQVGSQTLKAVAAAPESPGIFRFQLAPKQAGTGTLVVDIVTPDFTDRFTVPGVVVYADAGTARQQPGGEVAGDLAYSKEQGWELADFATQPLGRGTIKKGTAVLPNVLVLPLTAFVNVDGFPHVYVQRTGERFQLRPVQTGPGDGQQVQITGGVREGERVVTGGAQDLRKATAPGEHGHSH